MNITLLQRSSVLLRHDNLSSGEVRNLLAPVGFENWQTALTSLQRIAEASPQARDILSENLPSLLIALSQTATPNRVLVNFERFIQRADDPAELLRQLAANPRSFEILARLFAGSQFLTEILQRHPSYFEQLIDLKNLAQTRSRSQLYFEAQTAIRPFLGDDLNDLLAPMNALRRFQRYQLLRIGTCDLLGLIDLPSVTLQLSHLADSLIQAALTLAAWHTGSSTDGFMVIGMGKLGGEELNYSSDIDLIFLSGTSPNNYIKMGQTLIDILSRPTQNGFLYRVDMRLRPWGRSGALVSTLEGYISYLEKQAGLWERQALLKARPVAGTESLGTDFLTQSQPLIFDKHNEETLRDEIHRLKQRIEARLRSRGRTWGEVKLGQGSIRDIEFVTQYLQLLGGPDFATPTTLVALDKLSEAGVLPPDELRVLTDGYVFLRTVEHHLQLMHYRQTHALPKEPGALISLARRLGFQGDGAGELFTNQYQQHAAVIRAVYQRRLADDPLEPSNPTTKNGNAPDVLPLLVRMHPSYVATFDDADIEEHARLILKLDQSNPVQVRAKSLGGGYWQITVVGYDTIGTLSLICGLLVVYGLDIVEGHVFSYGPDPLPAASSKRSSRSRRRYSPPKPAVPLPEQKIVDVFTVRPVRREGVPISLPADVWEKYATDLAVLVTYLQGGDSRQAQGELAKRVALAVPQQANDQPTLLPVDIQIDNQSNERHTVLRIDALDTFGFLYEFTNALALAGINVRRMTVASVGSRVQDVLYVTDRHKNKITDINKQRELRVATVLIKHFTHLLPRSPNPESALLHFREFVAQLFRRPNWPDELTSLEEPEVLSNLARLLGISDFLWSDFLRMQHANLFPVVSDVVGLEQASAKAELREDLAVLLHTTPEGEARRKALNAFKDREMFRIDMRQIQGHIKEFGRFSAELTDLAEVVVEATTSLAGRELRVQYGIPRLANGSECALSVCALGKCGGREMGFASDIELMFIFSGNGNTTGPRVITNAEYFTKLIQEVNRTIQTRREGIFELDLRLRPYGTAGSMAISLESFENYFGPGGDAWPYERQALVKLRPIAADLNFGQKIVRLRDKLLFTGELFDVAAMRAMRERQLRHLVRAGTFDAKFSPGALVDAEYLVQGLQITYGHLDASLRQPNTRATMQTLAAMKIIPAADYPRLFEGYIFLRNLINALRIVRGNAKDLTVPESDSEAFNFLARRLNYGDDLIRLQNDLFRHTDFIYKLNRRLLDRLVQAAEAQDDS